VIHIANASSVIRTNEYSFLDIILFTSIKFYLKRYIHKNKKIVIIFLNIHY